jgi:hypothetical protein
VPKIKIFLMNNVAYVFGLEILSVEIHVVCTVCVLHIYAHVYGRKLDTCCHLSTKFAINKFFNDFLQFGIGFFV